MTESSSSSRRRQRCCCYAFLTVVVVAASFSDAFSTSTVPFSSFASNKLLSSNAPNAPSSIPASSSKGIIFRRIRRWHATPEAKFGRGSEQFDLIGGINSSFSSSFSSSRNYNDTTGTALSASTVAAADVELEQPERTWIQDIESELIVEYSDSSLQSSASSYYSTPSVSSSSSSSSLLSADILGPFLSIVLTILFLFYTLLHDCGYGISDKFLTMDISHKVHVLSNISWLPGKGSEAQSVVALVMAISSFAQALTGFGFAVVAVGAMSSMPWLLHSELYDVITPVAATLGALVGFILLIPYAFSNEPATPDNPGLEWNEILPLLIPCTVLTPLGMQLNSMVDPIIGTRILAALIMGFVGYKLLPMIQDVMNENVNENVNNNEDIGGSEDLLLSLSSSSSVALEVVGVESESESETTDANNDSNNNKDKKFLQSKTAAIVFGCAAGIFGGAFDVQGPPLCIYGDAKGWSPAQFRNNILTVVALNSAFVVGIDSIQGGVLDNFYYSYFCLTSLPGVLAGVVLGQYASKRIDPILFKNLVLIMCLGLGIQLLTVS
jgi:uncharacterized membrane protein YfcA